MDEQNTTEQQEKARKRKQNLGHLIGVLALVAACVMGIAMNQSNDAVPTAATATTSSSQDVDDADTDDADADDADADDADADDADADDADTDTDDDADDADTDTAATEEEPEEEEEEEELVKYYRHTDTGNYEYGEELHYFESLMEDYEIGDDVIALMLGDDYSWVGYTFYDNAVNGATDIYIQTYYDGSRWSSMGEFMKFIVNAVIAEHPDLHMSDGMDIYGKSAENRVNHFMPNLKAYPADGDALVQAAIEDIAKQTEGCDTQRERAKMIADILAASWSYDDETELSATPYGALIEHKAKCSGFARAYQMCCEYVGIPCWSLSGEDTDEYLNHAFNILKVDGEVIWVDMTKFTSNQKYFSFDHDNKYFDMTSKTLQNYHMREYQVR